MLIAGHVCIPALLSVIRSSNFFPFDCITASPALSIYSTLAFASSNTFKASTLDANGTDEDALGISPDEDNLRCPTDKIQKEEIEGANQLSDDDIEKL
ncbi:uncharacterized protein FOMMEDRAFT_150266 [Fomitiporia mediterranea MF3/22]|uniref:uncharacterized protein n=1 Tax=Fomitiporia mediterranea (strain MF3/22) TaxID=694068 RepID=UPI0004409987|nr:uncharacterized protein FOMMEDRAFT_150266 [Fomitiporia mediterranea MF3/22]EJD07725.1 hypothetical protein FOMMEDRAFT_150266 [Fomitiporia mediterranea MF3/22]